MEQYQAEQIAQTGQRINDPVQAQQIYSALSNNAATRMQFLERHADLLATGVNFGGMNYQQTQEVAAQMEAAAAAQNEADAKAYAQYVANKPDPDDFWSRPNTIQGR